jgi:hypothetical protein
MITGLQLCTTILSNAAVSPTPTHDPSCPQLSLWIRGTRREFKGHSVYAVRELDGLSGHWVMAVYAFCPDRPSDSIYLKIPEGLAPGYHKLHGREVLRAGCFRGRNGHFSSHWYGEGELFLVHREEGWLEGRFSFSAGRLSPPYDVIGVRNGYFLAPVR